MNEFEELKRRKEKLELERDIARLERNASFARAANSWSWSWVIPLGLLGVISLIVALAKLDQGPHDWGLFLSIGLILVAPAVAKKWSKLPVEETQT